MNRQFPMLIPRQPWQGDRPVDAFDGYLHPKLREFRFYAGRNDEERGLRTARHHEELRWGGMCVLPIRDHRREPSISDK
jgi:hypothetical protein